MVFHTATVSASYHHAPPHPRTQPDVGPRAVVHQPHTSAGVYEIVAGERRFRAVSQVLGWEAIPAIVRDLDDEATSAIMLAENTRPTARLGMYSANRLTSENQPSAPLLMHR